MPIYTLENGGKFFLGTISAPYDPGSTWPGDLTPKWNLSFFENSKKEFILAI